MAARWILIVLLAYRRVEEPSPKVVRRNSVTSTQDVARALPIGSVVVAEHQTAGRGRLDRRWESRPGTALLVSFVLRPNPVLSLAAGVAAAEACGNDVRLKWPNDLLLGGAKVGGILVEAMAAGVPVRLPVEESNFAQEGLLVMENFNAPEAPETVG